MEYGTSVIHVFAFLVKKNSGIFLFLYKNEIPEVFLTKKAKTVSYFKVAEES